MSDEELLRARFSTFVGKIHKSLHGYAARMCITYPPSPHLSHEDLVSDVIRLALAKLEPDKTEDEWKAWLFSLIKYRAIDRFKKRKRRDEASETVIDTYNDAAAPSPAELTDLKSNAQNLQQAMLRMKPEEFRVLELRYFHNLDGYIKIAEAMNISVCNARKLHERAIKSLRKLLNQSGA